MYKLKRRRFRCFSIYRDALSVTVERRTNRETVACQIKLSDKELETRRNSTPEESLHAMLHESK